MQWHCAQTMVAKYGRVSPLGKPSLVGSSESTIAQPGSEHAANRNPRPEWSDFSFERNGLSSFTFGMTARAVASAVALLYLSFKMTLSTFLDTIHLTISLIIQHKVCDLYNRSCVSLQLIGSTVGGRPCAVVALAVRLPPPPLLGRLLGKWVSPEALTPTLTFLALSAFYIELRECPYSLRLTQPLTSLFGRRRDATYGLGKHEWGEPIISALLASSCTLLMATGERERERAACSRHPEE